MQPLTGWLARRFGEVKTFIASVGLFVVFSMLCGLATSMPMLVIARLLQGAGSGPMVALSLTLLLSSYPKAKQGIALAMWAMWTEGVRKHFNGQIIVGRDLMEI